MCMLAQMSLHMPQGRTALVGALEVEKLARSRFQCKILPRPNCYDFAVRVLYTIAMYQRRLDQCNCADTCQRYTADEHEHEDRGS